MNKALHFLLAVSIIQLAGLASKAHGLEQVDLLIRRGRVLDGSGSPWTQADVAIRGDTIVAVGRGPVEADRIIDAAGMVVSPGFIDMHAHSEYGLIVDPRGLSKVTQGVTTEVIGEHLSAGPVKGKAEDDPTNQGGCFGSWT